MRIKKAIIARVILPFTGEFSHSLRKRLWVRNIVVILVDENGEILGCGEGAPRPYVTGETLETVEENIRYLTGREDFPGELETVDQIWRMIDALPATKEMNASICALEMALLDAFARYKKKRVLDLFAKDYYTDSINYGAAIPLGTEELVNHVCFKIKNLGINKLKLKLGRDYSHNRMLLTTVDRIFQDGYDLKADVNGVWTYKTGLQHIELINDYKVKILEQPMSPEDPEIAGLSSETKKYNIDLMADESACTLDDLYILSDNRHYQMINIRVSKCGGLRRSLSMINYIRNSGMKFQIGCQLGESGLLSSAGRILSLLSNDSVYYDGSYDNLLLAENITDSDVSFSYGGKAYPLMGAGLGVNVNINKIRKMSEHLLTINL